MASLQDVLTPEGHEEYLEYFVFLPPNEYPDSDETLLKLNATLQSLSGDYIWQQDGVHLTRFADSNESNKQGDKRQEDVIRSADTDYVKFHGKTKFGDNIEDEWFATWVLLQLTKEIPNSIVRAVDTDGEYLLIEAADHLPTWAESDSVCRNRVFLHDGQIHLIPLSLNGKKDVNIPRKLTSVDDAVRIVRDHPDLTVASEAIQNAVLERLGDYPKKMLDNFHHANVMLPSIVSSVLSKKPDLISKFTTAFYYRDPLQMKAARLMSNSKPNEGLVQRRVRFTRCLYAMLSKQEFRPDAKSGWKFPGHNSSVFKMHSLGAKLTIGFEILMSSEPAMKQDISDPEVEVLDENWPIYLESLTNTGYFKEFLVDSKPYNVLMEKAKEFYMTKFSKKKQLGPCQDFSLRRLVQQVHQNSSQDDVTNGGVFADDDDSWINLNPETFEAMLHQKFRMDNKQPTELLKFPEKLKEFMNMKSNIEGVERSTGKSKSKKEEENYDVMDPLDFRAEDFVSAMDKVLAGLGAADHDWDESDDEEYSDEDGFMSEIAAKHNFKGDRNAKMFDLMSAMDEELKGTEVLNTKEESTEKGEFDDVEDFEPVNIDMHALTNMLKSLQSQDSLTGPSTNLFRSLGMDVAMNANADDNVPTTSTSKPSRKKK